MKNNSQLHHIECYGIIDRDYRTGHEINSLKNDRIYTIDVAEVENLFLVEELLLVVNEMMAFPNTDKVDNIKRNIIERYNNQIQRQICEAVVSELKFKLSSIDISKNNEQDAKTTLDNAYNQISYDDIKTEKENIFRSAINDYKGVLKVFNCKELDYVVSKEFIDIHKYEGYLIRQLKGEKKQEIIEAVKKYMPVEIPN